MMQKVSYEEYKDLNGNPVVGVSFSESRYYKSDDGSELAVISRRENGQYYARIVRDSLAYDTKRVDDSKSFNDRKDWEDAEEWVGSQIS